MTADVDAAPDLEHAGNGCVMIITGPLGEAQAFAEARGYRPGQWAHHPNEDTMHGGLRVYVLDPTPVDAHVRWPERAGL